MAAAACLCCFNINAFTVVVTYEMKRIPNEIKVLIAIFLAGVISVLWYVYEAKAKQRAEAAAAPVTLPAAPLATDR